MAHYEGRHLYPQNTVLLNKIKRVLLIVEEGIMKQMLLLISFFLCVHIYADSDLGQAIKVAEMGFKQYMSESTTPRGIDDLEISDPMTIRNATLGEPIEIMELTPASIVNYKQVDGVSKLLTKHCAYYFPILLYGKVRMLMGVYKYLNLGHKHYEIGSLSYVWLAKEFVKIREQNPELANHKMIFAECYAANAMVFSFPELDNQNLQFIDFSGDKATRAPQYSKLSTADELVKIMNGNIHEDIKKGVKK